MASEEAREQEYATLTERYFRPRTICQWADGLGRWGWEELVEQSAEIRLIVQIDEGKVEEGFLEATYNGGKTLVGDRKAAFAMSHVDLLT